MGKDRERQIERERKGERDRQTDSRQRGEGWNETERENI